MSDDKILRQTNAATLVMGDTGTGKTTLLATLALWVYKKFGKRTRLYAYDLGGFGDMMLALVKHKIVEVWRVTTRDPDGNLGLPLETCQLAALGYWPDQLIDMEKGDSLPGCTLVAPFSTAYEMYCTCGKLARPAVDNQQVLQQTVKCPGCGKQLNRASSKEVRKVRVMAPGFERIGAQLHDSLTGMSEWCLTDMGQRHARNLLGGEGSNILPQMSGDLKFGVANRAAVGFVQERVRGWFTNANSVPGMVVPAHFTARVDRATDDRTKLLINGPKIAGSAKTAEVPAWVGNCLGAVIYPGDKGDERRLYLTAFEMPGDNIPYLCKIRSVPHVMPDFLRDEPEEPLFTKFNLGHFWELMEGGFSKAEEWVLKQLEGVTIPEPAAQVKIEEVIRDAAAAVGNGGAGGGAADAGGQGAAGASGASGEGAQPAAAALAAGSAPTAGGGVAVAPVGAAATTAPAPAAAAGPPPIRANRLAPPPVGRRRGASAPVPQKTTAPAGAEAASGAQEAPGAVEPLPPTSAPVGVPDLTK